MSTSPTPAVAPVSESVWKRITGFFHAAGHLVSEAFITLFGKDAATHFASASLALLKTTVGQIAMAAVTEAGKVASGTEARVIAFATLTSEIEKLGLSAATSEKNMLLELALQAVKGKFGTMPI